MVAEFNGDIIPSESGGVQRLDQLQLTELDRAGVSEWALKESEFCHDQEKDGHFSLGSSPSQGRL